jgi:hypothetical protein
MLREHAISVDAAQIHVAAIGPGRGDHREAA